MFEFMEVVEQFYKVVTPYKTTNHRAYTNCDSHGIKLTGGEDTLLINPDKGHTRNFKKIYVEHPINHCTSENMIVAWI